MMMTADFNLYCTVLCVI